MRYEILKSYNSYLIVYTYLPAVLPAFRRTCSPEYRIPFPLYGSGFLSDRI